MMLLRLSQILTGQLFFRKRQWTETETLQDIIKCTRVERDIVSSLKTKIYSFQCIATSWDPGSGDGKFSLDEADPWFLSLQKDSMLVDKKDLILYSYLPYKTKKYFVLLEKE